jgi:hypothetical protein
MVLFRYLTYPDVNPRFDSLEVRRQAFAQEATMPGLVFAQTEVRWSRTGRKLAALAFALILTFVWLPAAPTAGAAPALLLLNPGFEDGNLAGWTASSSDLVSVVNQHIAPNSNYAYSPAEGGHFALLEPSEPDVPTTLRQTFAAQPGDVVSCWTFFDGEDAPDWNDYGDVRILLGDQVVATVYQASVSSAGDLGYLPWSRWSFTVTVTADYTLEARVANAVDNTMPSYLGLDGCSVGPHISVYLPSLIARR